MTMTILDTIKEYKLEEIEKKEKERIENKKAVEEEKKLKLTKKFHFQISKSLQHFMVVFL